MTEFFDAAQDYILPHLFVPCNIMTQHLVVILFDKPSMYKTQHLQIDLDLNMFVLDDPTEKTVSPVLNLDQSP